MIEKVVQVVRIPVNVMIRPHAKSFEYTQEEIDIMKRDIAVAKELGVNGVVFGTLDEYREISGRRVKELAECCSGVDITFHKAIDELSDIVKGINTLAAYPGIKTVLTAGGEGCITENLPILKEIIAKSGHLKIMVGGGLNFENIRQMIEETGATEYHFGTVIRYNRSYFCDIDEKKLRELIDLVG
jgi:copper homeostasis protein